MSNKQEENVVTEEELEAQIQAAQAKRVESAGKMIEAILSEHKLAFGVVAVSPNQQAIVPISHALLPGWGTIVNLVPQEKAK